MADWIGLVVGWAIVIVAWLLTQVYAAGPGVWIVSAAILALAASLRLLRGQIYSTGDAILQQIKALVDETRNLKGAVDRIELSFQIEEPLELLLKDEREKRGYVYVCINNACEVYGQHKPIPIPGTDQTRDVCEKCRQGFGWIRPTP